MEDTMVKNFILCLILMPFFVSCGNEVNNSNDENGVKNDQDIAENEKFDDDEKTVTDEDAQIDEVIDEENDKENCRPPDGGTDTFVKVTYEEDKCAYSGERTFKMLHLVEPADHTAVYPDIPEKKCVMTIDNIEGGEIENFSAGVEIPESDFYYVSEKQIYTDISGTAEGDKCWGADRYTIRFSGYDRDLFNDSMIGKKIVFYTVWNYRAGTKVNIVAYEDNTWIIINGFALGAPELNPGINVYKSTMLQCATHCVYGMSHNGFDIPNYTIQPPVQFDVEGLDEVVLIRNGESQIIGDYEFYADFSVAISDKDPDGIFTVTADYDPLPSPNGQFYFSVLNIGALK